MTAVQPSSECFMITLVSGGKARVNGKIKPLSSATDRQSSDDKPTLKDSATFTHGTDYVEWSVCTA